MIVRKGDEIGQAGSACPRLRRSSFPERELHERRVERGRLAGVLRHELVRLPRRGQQRDVGSTRGSMLIHTYIPTPGSGAQGARRPRRSPSPPGRFHLSPFGARPPDGLVFVLLAVSQGPTPGACGRKIGVTL